MDKRERLMARSRALLRLETQTKLVEHTVSVMRMWGAQDRLIDDIVIEQARQIFEGLNRIFEEVMDQEHFLRNNAFVVDPEASVEEYRDPFYGGEETHPKG